MPERLAQAPVAGEAGGPLDGVLVGLGRRDAELLGPEDLVLLDEGAQVAAAELVLAGGVRRAVELGRVALDDLPLEVGRLARRLHARRDGQLLVGRAVGSPSWCRSACWSTPASGGGVKSSVGVKRSAGFGRGAARGVGPQERRERRAGVGALRVDQRPVHEHVAPAAHDRGLDLARDLAVVGVPVEERVRVDVVGLGDRQQAVEVGGHAGAGQRRVLAGHQEAQVPVAGVGGGAVARTRVGAVQAAGVVLDRGGGRGDVRRLGVGVAEEEDVGAVLVRRPGQAQVAHGRDRLAVASDAELGGARVRARGGAAVGGRGGARATAVAVGGDGDVHATPGRARVGDHARHREALVIGVRDHDEDGARGGGVSRAALGENEQQRERTRDEEHGKTNDERRHQGTRHPMRA